MPSAMRMTATLIGVLDAGPVEGSAVLGRLMVMPMQVVFVPAAVRPSIESVCAPMSMLVGMVSSVVK